MPQRALGAAAGREPIMPGCGRRRQARRSLADPLAGHYLGGPFSASGLVRTGGLQVQAAIFGRVMGGRARRLVSAALALGIAASPAFAKSPLLRSYLTFEGGFDVLMTNLSGDVVQNRTAGLVDIGVGYQFGSRFVVEGTYGWLGRYRQAGPIQYVPPREEYPPDEARAFQVTVNPFLVRLRYARSGVRTGYLKPEWSLGLGFYQVTSFLRNYQSVPPEESSQLLPAAELGVAALFIFGPNFTMQAGGRYTLMQRRAIVDDTRHFDGLTIALGFRVFLPSPRDEGENPSTAR